MLTRQQLKKLIKYKPETGLFYWRVSQGNKKAGQSAGTYSSRYPMVSINKKRYDLHRIAWLYMTGRWPAVEIDHKDRNPHNNRWRNLREATTPQNRANAKQRKSNLGHTGVWKQRNKYIARITADKRIYNLGSFSTLKAALAARKNAEKIYHGEFARSA